MRSAWLELALMREYGVRQPLTPIELPAFMSLRKALAALRADEEPRVEVKSGTAA
jgi:hypothetical protein